MRSPLKPRCPMPDGHLEYIEISLPGPNAPLVLMCDGCGDPVSTWTGWNERVWQDGRPRATKDLDLCATCAAEVVALPAGARYVPAKKRTREPHVERACVVAFLERHAPPGGGPSIANLRELAARIQRGDHRTATRSRRTSA